MTNNIDKVLREKNKTITWLINEVGEKKKWAVYKWVENSSQPNIFTLYKIAMILNVKMEDLIYNG